VLLGYTVESEPSSFHKILNQKEGVKIVIHGPISKQDGAEAVCIAKACDAVAPHPSTKDTLTAINGFNKRIAEKIGDVNPLLMKEFSLFVKNWLALNVNKFNLTDYFKFDEWLSTRDYNEQRKQQLRDAWNEIPNVENLSDFHKFCKSFIKDEFYEEFKPARTINSRTDNVKALIGAVCHAMEKQLFQHPSFIKYIDVRNRPKYIFDRLFVPGYFYAETDYSSLEASLDSDIMEACEIQLYTHLLDGGCHQDVLDLLADMLVDEQVLNFKTFTGFVESVRCSGEMVTSVGNGFTNLMVMQFIASKIGCELVCVVEGDDGLTGIPPQFVDPLVNFPFDQLGLSIKIKIHNELNHASFCGIIYDLIDKVAIVDPREYLITFGFLNIKYRNARDSKLLSILHCKALSFLHQYEGCPIIDALARRLLELTRDKDFRWYLASNLDLYTKQKYVAAAKYFGNGRVKGRMDISRHTRFLMAEKFGISEHEQIQIEKDLFSADLLSMKTNIKSILYILPDHWAMNYIKCVRPNDYSVAT